MGNLIMIVGPMYAGKTTKLIDIATQFIREDKKVQLFKPDIDTRYHTTKIVTHDGKSIDAEVIPATIPTFDQMKPDTDVVVIDELHFFDPVIINEVLGLLKSSVHIVVSGVNKDFRGEPMRNIRELLPYADEIHMLHAICAVCGNEAPLSQRLVNGKPAKYDDPIVAVGSVDMYEPRCRNCHAIAL
jgi:thymidine kinase